MKNLLWTALLALVSPAVAGPAETLEYALEWLASLPETAENKSATVWTYRFAKNLEKDVPQRIHVKCLAEGQNLDLFNYDRNKKKLVPHSGEIKWGDLHAVVSGSPERQSVTLSRRNLVFSATIAEDAGKCSVLGFHTEILD